MARLHDDGGAVINRAMRTSGSRGRLSPVVGLVLVPCGGEKARPETDEVVRSAVRLGGRRLFLF